MMAGFWPALSDNLDPAEETTTPSSALAVVTPFWSTVAITGMTIVVSISSPSSFEATEAAIAAPELVARALEAAFVIWVSGSNDTESLIDEGTNESISLAMRSTVLSELLATLLAPERALANPWVSPSDEASKDRKKFGRSLVGTGTAEDASSRQSARTIPLALIWFVDHENKR
jgi:hypothetical protein